MTKSMKYILFLFLFLLFIWSVYQNIHIEGLDSLSPNPNVGAKVGKALGAKPCSEYSAEKCTISIGIRNTGNNGANLKATQKTGRCKFNALNKKCY